MSFADRAAELIAYCRIDPPNESEMKLLEGMYQDAVSYMTQAGVSEPVSGSARLAQYNTCINALVLDAWDNRSIQTGDKALTDNPAFRRRLNQLKLTEPVVSESDTEG